MQLVNYHRKPCYSPTVGLINCISLGVESETIVSILLRLMVT